MRLRECSVLILALLAVGLPAQASPWYPIDTGHFWVYSRPGGGSSSGTVGAPEMFAGSLVQPIHWDSGSRECFAQDGAGRVFEHGLTYPDGSYVVFDPPFLRMDSDLTPGHQWESNFDVISYDAGGVEVSRDGAHQIFQVIGVGPVDVPAGTFQAVEIEITRDTVNLPFYRFREWYAEGVGMIRRSDQSGVVFELVDYGPKTVSIMTSSWGAVKAMYRD